MQVAMLTREWPPDIYGGAGVHVEFLARELRRLVDVDVHCFGADKPGATAHASWSALDGANASLQVLSTDLAMAAGVAGTDLVHSHTWYANFAGHLAKLLYDVPHVMTSHSLEPLRPWKAEQLGGGYAVSMWAERTAIEAADAVVAVSHGMRADVLTAYPRVDPDRVHVVHNGIDTELFTPRPDPDSLRSLGLDPGRPSVLYVGRITRQKGLPHLLRAAQRLPREVQVLLCASAPDTPEIAAEVEAGVDALAGTRDGVVWLRDAVSRPQLNALLSTVTAFVCPSVYEPLGIVNLEAMACGAPVIASAVGGIPEVVDDGVTGRLVPYDAADETGFEAALAAAIEAVVADPDQARRMGSAGRERAVREFGWAEIARRTVELYASVLSRPASAGTS